MKQRGRFLDTTIDIYSLTLKASPVDADVMLLEDSADSWVKKKVLVSSLKSAAGLGDVDGPASSTDNTIPRFDGITGKIIQGSLVILDDSDNMTFNNAAGPAIQNEAATSTNPTLIPNKADLDTGMGWTSANILSLISGGVEQARLGITGSFLNLHETYTDASNYERYTLDAGVTTADTLTIQALSAGTGSANLGIALTPKGTGTIKVPAGTVTNPIIVSDDADSGFYFGSKGFNWGVDGVKMFGLSSIGIASFDQANVGSVLATSYVNTPALRPATAVTLGIQMRDFTAADNMIEMATGTTTFTGFDGEIVGVNIMPTVGVLDDGDTMTLLKLSPTGTPASTLGIMRCLTFGNWGGTGTDKAYMIDATATGYDAVMKVTSAAVTTAGTLTGQIPVDVDGTTYYVYYYTTGS